VARKPVLPSLCLRQAVASAAAFLICASCAMTLAPSSSAAGMPGFGGVSVRPAHFDPRVPATRAYFIRAVDPGRSFRDQVIVANDGARPVRLFVYPVDGLTGVTSGTVYANRQDPRRKASRWVSMASGPITVAAHGSVSVPFTVHVPKHAIPGDHVAGIAFEDAASVRSGGHFSVTLVTRQVVGVEIQVAGPARRRLVVRGISLQSLPGTARAAAVVMLANVGRRLCKPLLRVALATRVTHRPTTSQLDTVLPGDQIPYPLPWPRTLLAGSYRATARVTRCGPPATIETIVHLGRRLRGREPAAAPAVATGPPAASSGVPLWALIPVALGGLGLGLVVRRRSRPIA